MPRSLASGMAVLLSIALAAPRAQAATVLGAESPEELVARVVKAGETKNLSEMVACLEPPARVQISMGLLAGATMMVGLMGMGTEMAAGMAEAAAEGTAGKKMKASEKAKLDKAKREAAAKTRKSKTALAAIFKTHGLPNFFDEKAGAALPEDKEGATEMLSAIDHPALVADLMKFMDAFGDKTKAKEAEAEAPDAPESPVPIGADVVVKDYKIKGDKATAKAGKEKLEFVRIDERWFLKAPKDKKKK